MSLCMYELMYVRMYVYIYKYMYVRMYVCIYAPINASSFNNPECLHRALIEVPVRSLHPDTLSTRSFGQPMMIALIPIHVCMSMYEYVWVCMSMFEYV